MEPSGYSRMQDVPDDIEVPELENPIAVMPGPKMTQGEFASLGRVPWEVRYEKIQKEFPSVANVNWDVILDRDMDVFGRILRDILKLEQAPLGRPGPRPSLDVGDGTRRMAQLFGNDFTVEPFHRALKVLAGDKTVRELAAFLGLNHITVHRLLKGKKDPDGYVMRVAAKAFDKHPSYFLEWRLLFITGSIIRRLEWSPDTSIDIYKMLDAQGKPS